MKQILLFVLLIVAGPSAAQHIELIGRAGLGLSRFGGRGAANGSAISYYYNEYFNGTPGGTTYTPYGRKVGAGFTLSGRVQRVGQRNGLLALDLSYDKLRSQVTVNQVDYASALYSSFRATTYQADGSTTLTTQNLTAFLGLGHRFAIGKVSLDLLAGPEAAYVFGIRQKGSGTYNIDSTWVIGERRSASNRADVRLRADATAWYQRVGCTASYSHGLLNYQGNLEGSDNEVYARILRLGLAYRLR